MADPLNGIPAKPGGLDSIPTAPSGGVSAIPQKGAVPGIPQKGPESDLLTDPQFQELLSVTDQFNKSLESSFNGKSAPLQDKIHSLTSTLVQKYNIDPRQLNVALAKQMPGFAQKVAGAQQETAGAGRLAIGISNSVAPLQIPQQTLFHQIAGVTDAIKAAGEPGSLWQKVSAGADAYGSVVSKTPIKGLLEAPAHLFNSNVPGMIENKNMMTFGQQLQSWGVKNKTAIRLGGFAGDLFADPLLFGSYVRGVGKAMELAGKAAKSGEMVSTAKGVAKMGDALTGALSPAGATTATNKVGSKIVSTIGKATKIPTAAEWTAEKTTNVMADLVNTVMQWPPKGIHIPGMPGRYTLGEMFTGESRNPLRPTADVLTGGSGMPDAMTQGVRKATGASQDYLDMLNQSLENFSNALGLPRTKKWMQDVATNAKGYEGIPKRLAAFPQAMQDGMLSLLSETADNVGAMQLPKALARAGEMDFGLGRKSATAAKQVLQNNLADELKTLALPAMESNILKINTERVAKLAAKHGIPADTAVTAFHDALGQLVATDAMDGWLKSLAGPIKETVFEAVGKAGGGAGDAGKAWQDIFSAALNERDWRAVKLPGVTRTNAAGEAVAATAGDVLPKMTGQMDLGVAMRALRDGHLSRSYAVGQTPENFAKFLDTLRNGQVFPNRILDSRMYGPALNTAVQSNGWDSRIPALIKGYVEDVSPTLPQERGFIIPQENVIKHLVDNGVDPQHAKAALGHIIKLANGGPDAPIPKMIDDIMSTAAGRTGGAAGRPLQSTGKAAVSARKLGYDATQAGQQADTETMQMLGRLLSPQTQLMESARSTVSNYPSNQFLFDTWKLLDENGLLHDSLATTPDLGVTFDYMRGAHYGPLNGKVAPKQFIRWVDNSLTRGDPNGFMAMMGKFRQVVYPALLASLTTTIRNAGGNTLNAMMFGRNPLGAWRYYAKASKAVEASGGFTKIPTYADMGQIFETNLVHEAYSQNIKFAKGLASGITQSNFESKLTDWSKGFVQSYQKILDRPSSVLGPLESKIPGAKAAGNVLGLHAFQYMENVAKYAEYLQSVDEGRPMAEAIRRARHVVFDYTAQPKIVQWLRNMSVVPFPAFPAFVTARQLNSIINRPGTLAAMDRLPTALWNAEFLDENKKRQAYASLHDYMQQDGKFIPIQKQDNADGGTTMGMYPLGYALPTSPLGGLQSYMQTVGGGGAPPATTIFDLINAFGNHGEAGPSAKYGNRMWEPAVHDLGVGASAATQVRQAAQAIANTYMPSGLRRLINFGPAGKPAQGVLPDIWNIVRPLPGDGLGQSMLKMQELQKGKADKNLFDSVMSFFVGSIQPVSTNPALNPVTQGKTNSDFNYQYMTKYLDAELNKIATDPNLSSQERIQRISAIQQQLEKLGVAPVGRINDVLGKPQSP